MKDNPLDNAVVLIIVLILSIILAIVWGVFILVPVGIGYLIWLYVTKEPTVSAKEIYDATPDPWPSRNDVVKAFVQRTLSEETFMAFEIGSNFHFAAEQLFDAEGFERPPYFHYEPGSIQEARYKDRLRAFQEKSQDPTETIRAFVDAIYRSYMAFRAHLPPLARDLHIYDGSPFMVPIKDALVNIDQAIDELISPFFDSQYESMHMFDDFREIIESKGKKKGVERLIGTPFETLFDTRIPFHIPDSRMMEHAVLIAGSGGGKTQTLGALIAGYIERPDPPSMVVIDSTGALIKKIQKLEVFAGRLKGRLVIIDPEHSPIPALNMFDISNPRLQGYTEAMKASIETEVVNLFNYIFSSANNDLTARQGTVFSYVVRLVLSIPNSNITTLLNILEEKVKKVSDSKYKPAIDMLDETAQEFFRNQYFNLDTFRDQIAQRVYSLIQVPAFRDMFNTQNKVDFYDELQNKGSIILVNTSEMLLKDTASPLFGRYIIARTMAAAFERASKPEKERRPTLLFVDEAAPFMDDTFDKLLTRVRQFKLGMCMAFQHTEQMSEKLRSAVASNTSVKIAGSLGYTDSRWLARDMETTPEFLKAQKRDGREPPQYTHLACFVRNYTQTAVSLQVPFYRLENMPQMTDEDYAVLLDENRKRVSYVRPKDWEPPDRPYRYREKKISEEQEPPEWS